MPDKEPRQEPLSYREIGELFGMRPKLVERIAYVALEKLRRHPLMQEVAKEMGVLTDE